MPKETKRAISAKDADALYAEIARLKKENQTMESLLTSVADHYLGLEVSVAALLQSVTKAKYDSKKLVNLFEKRRQQRQELAEKGVQQGGTG